MSEIWFEDAELVLLKLISNIMQASHKESSRLANAVIAKASLSYKRLHMNRNIRHTKLVFNQ